MHAKIKITLLFTTIMVVLLSILCGYIYYAFYTSRIETIKTQLINRAVTTAHLLSQPDIYNDTIIKKIDATPWVSIKDKTVQVYDYNNQRIFTYADKDGDTVNVKNDLLHKVKVDKTIYFSNEQKDVLVYYDEKNRMSVLAAAYDEMGKSNLRRMKIILWLSFAGGIIIALISGYFFSKLLLKPVQKIADEVNDISIQNLTKRIEAGNTDDEWNYLSKTLNDLLDRLQESFQIQRRFISSASHELSTPLTAISSQLYVTLQNERSNQAYRNTIQSVYKDIRGLNKLTQTLLEFAAISDDPGGIKLKLVRIDEVLLQIPAELKKIDEKFVMKLDFDNLPDNDEHLLVFGNEELLLSAIKNIVFNACKYSADNTAYVKLSVEPITIILVIEDKGIGITPEELTSIFEPFYRAGDRKSRSGFGMGLPLVKRIIKFHKGEISVSSEVNKGTVFRITLPIATKISSS